MTKRKNQREIKELPHVFKEIAERFATAYLFAYQMRYQAQISIDVAKFPLSLLKSAGKDFEESLFNEMFVRLLDNDKKLTRLLKEAKIDTFKLNKN